MCSKLPTSSTWLPGGGGGGGRGGGGGEGGSWHCSRKKAYSLKLKLTPELSVTGEDGPALDTVLEGMLPCHRGRLGGLRDVSDPDEERGCWGLYREDWLWESNRAERAFMVLTWASLLLSHTVFRNSSTCLRDSELCSVSSG